MQRNFARSNMSSKISANMALSYTDLKKGVRFTRDGDPYEVVESNFLRMQQRKAVVQTKIKNLRTGKLYDVSFRASDELEEAELEKRPLIFLYSHRAEFTFADPKERSRRFPLSGKEAVGEKERWLKPNTEVTALFFKGKIINFSLPVKMDFKVAEAPPGVQGDRSQSGTKSVTIETGTTVQTPLFINTGDIIRVNTETGEYAERVEKAG